MRPALTTLASIGVVAALASGCANASATSTPSTAAPTTSAASTASPSTTGTSISSTPKPASSTTAPGAVDPNAPEVVAPGDIPDNQVFILVTPTPGYTIKVPEGWAKTESQGAIVYTDKYNSIALRSATATTAPTVATVRASGLADVSTDPTFKLGDVTSVQRKAGTVILATYEIGSAPNPVTGKKALLAVERYVYFHDGTEVTVTLAGAKGADNVDPWKTVTDSLTWH